LAGNDRVKQAKVCHVTAGAGTRLCRDTLSVVMGTKMDQSVYQELLIFLIDFRRLWDLRKMPVKTGSKFAVTLIESKIPIRESVVDC